MDKYAISVTILTCAYVYYMFKTTKSQADEEAKHKTRSTLTFLYLFFILVYLLVLFSIRSNNFRDSILVVSVAVASKLIVWP